MLLSIISTGSPFESENIAVKMTWLHSSPLYQLLIRRESDIIVCKASQSLQACSWLGYSSLITLLFERKRHQATSSVRHSRPEGPAEEDRWGLASGHNDLILRNTRCTALISVFIFRNLLLKRLLISHSVVSLLSQQLSLSYRLRAVSTFRRNFVKRGNLEKCGGM